VRAGAIVDFPPDALTPIELSGRRVNVVRTPGGTYALGDKCPHQGASMSRAVLCGTMLASRPGEFTYGMDKEIVRCPWHRWEFRADTGQAIEGISRKRMVTYPVRVEDGSLFIELPGGDLGRPSPS
jgi:nitrite reductase (NADH) small subunit